MDLYVNGSVSGNTLIALVLSMFQEQSWELSAITISWQVSLEHNRLIW